jgi:mannitol/fructose-specific phosphotransferase system IIA component (Ntr-type)
MGETEAFINKNGGSETSRLFCEMFHLYEEPGLANAVWREKVRWLKFEEKVEDGGGVFSQPHVAALPNSSMKELEDSMAKSTVILDCEAESFEDLVKIMVEDLDSGEKSKIEEILNSEKVHQFEAKSKLKALRKGKDSAKKEENAFQKRIESGDEGVLIFCESIPTIKKPQLIMARLKNSTLFENCCEVDIKTKFVFVLLGPGSHDEIQEMGRCIGTLMSDETFQKSAQKAKKQRRFYRGC